jgi:hypothetical protein
VLLLDKTGRNRGSVCKNFKMIRLKKLETPSGRARKEKTESDKKGSTSPPLLQKLMFYCRRTSARTAPCTSRRMCCPTHCASYCADLASILRMDSTSTCYTLSLCPSMDHQKTESDRKGSTSPSLLHGSRRLVMSR